MNLGHFAGHGAMKLLDQVMKDPKKALGTAIAVATNPLVIGTAVATVAVVAAVAIYNDKKEDDKKNNG